MHLGPVGDVFYFVEDLVAATQWYAERLDLQPIARQKQLVVFDVNGTRLTLHASDEYNSPGPAGVSVYWNVADVDQFIAEWTAHGARVHRGPKTVFSGDRLCQFIDPFGNLFAIREPAKTS
jgi:predicted enzyme related to lactoylglutathione lyase